MMKRFILAAASNQLNSVSSLLKIISAVLKFEKLNVDSFQPKEISVYPIKNFKL
jgi:hypothetical protein